MEIWKSLGSNRSCSVLGDVKLIPQLCLLIYKMRVGT